MESSTNLVGRTIGKYRIVELLGRGGMAEVYKAYQANLDRHVAVKVMHAFLADDPGFTSRFEREAKNVGALRHPNIVQVYDFDVEQGMPYMVMEFIEGGTLKTYLEELAQRDQSVPLPEALRIIQQVGEALAYAHKRNMMHRDVKPANVMLDAGGRAVLTDFGIAKILTGPSHTASGSTIGTPAYMAPEQGMGQPGDYRSDIYSLGVMLYQLSTGQLPYDADTPLAVMLKHVNDPLPLPRSIRPDLPEGVERIILKSMAKSPEYRFQNVEEMLAPLSDLETAAKLTIPSASMAAGVSASATTAPGATQVSAPPAPADTLPAARVRPAPPMLLVIAAIVVLALGVGGGAFLLRGGLAGAPTASPTSPATLAPSATTAQQATAANFTLTPDAQATALQATLQALVQALATATPSSTPDLTQTALACAFAYAITGQDPADGSTLPLNRITLKKVTLQNTGACAYPAGTSLVETTDPAEPNPATLAVPEIDPGDSAQLEFEWTGLGQAGSATRTWELRLPDGRAIGDPLTFTLRYVVFATAAPTRTSTTPPRPTTPTPAASGLSDVYPQAFVGCVYQGDNQMDYNCTARLGYVGGIGPFTLYYNGNRIASYQPGEAIHFNIIGRRCFPALYNLRLVDDGTVSQISKDFAFEPASYASLFPGAGCALP
ncbi:MAG: protein kinase domain-containing protein [Anaerolineales bacterium]